MLTSPLEEMVPTSADDPTFLARFSMSLTTALTARSMPRFKSIGFMPAATDLAPSLMMAWASTVAVVVLSPAMSLVFWATSRTIWAPMFSNLSPSSISLATVPPSLGGAPNDLSSTTLRPLGPSVTRTALASTSTPRSILSRASVENLSSFAAMSIHSWFFLGYPPFRPELRHLPSRHGSSLSWARLKENWVADLAGRTGKGYPRARVGLGKVDKRPSGWYWTISDTQIPHSRSIVAIRE